MPSFSQKIRLIESFEDKLVKLDTIKSKIEHVFQSKSEPIIESLRRINKLIYVLQGYYYIQSESERKTQNTKYSSLEMVAVVLNRLKVNWYVGLTSALELNKVIWQASKEIVILNNLFSKKISVNKTMITFKKTSIDQEGIIEVITPNRVKINIASNERTYLDLMYFKRKIPAELMQRLNEQEVLKLVSEYPERVEQEVLTWLN